MFCTYLTLSVLILRYAWLVVVIHIFMTAGRESYGRSQYQPNRIMVLVREELDEEAIKSPFTSLLTENVVNVRIFFLK